MANPKPNPKQGMKQFFVDYEVGRLLEYAASMLTFEVGRRVTQKKLAEVAIKHYVEDLIERKGWGKE